MFKISASREHACLQSLTKVLDSPCHMFPRKVIPDHLQSCAKLLDCWLLTVVFILSTRPQNGNASTLPILFRNLSKTLPRWCPMVLVLNGMALHLTAHATQDWLHATAMTLLRSMNGRKTRQIIMRGVSCWKPISSWTTKPSTTELQTRLEIIWNDLTQKPVTRAVQKFCKRLQACMFKASGHFEHLMRLTLC